MDFCQLLHKAQKNDQNSTNGVRYYSTKFEPPKKVKKETKDLSENIKKFLAKKEAEEQRKREEERKKKEELLALRSQDKKATRRVNVMLKRTKSANQSVIEDAVDKTHTAVTRAGPEQPDEDDYGYVSQEATALYEKMMEKYSQMPEEPKFDMFKKKVSTNLNSTKDRVKAALEKEREEAMQPHRRKRKKKNGDNPEGSEQKDDDGDGSSEENHSSKDDAKESKEKDVPKPKPKPTRPPPPAMSFSDILKLAAQKQHEPIIIEQKPQEEEKLYTKKQKRELEKEREWREKREQRRLEMERDEREKAKSMSKPIPKNGESKILERQLTRPNGKSHPNNEDKDKASTKHVRFAGSEQKPSNESFKKPAVPDRSSKPSTGSSSSSSNGALKTVDSSRPKNAITNSTALKNSDSRPKSGDYKAPSHDSRPKSGDYKNPNLLPSKSGNSSSSVKASQQNDFSKSKSLEQKPSGPPKNGYSSGPSKMSLGKPEMVPRKGGPPQVASGKLVGKPKEFPPRDLQPKSKPKEFPPRDLKPKQFPPPDVRGIKRKKPMVASRGRIIDDDDEEYDSEMDDFIDDDPEEDDYSSYIKEIFGYDKSRYRDVDDDVDNMESSFAQQMKEEVISTKIGIMEDLEDMKKEEEEKRRKALMKKKMKR